MFKGPYFIEGQKAFELRQPRSSNPYLNGPKRKSWQHGFDYQHQLCLKEIKEYLCQAQSA